MIFARNARLPADLRDFENYIYRSDTDHGKRYTTIIYHPVPPGIDVSSFPRAGTGRPMGTHTNSGRACHVPASGRSFSAYPKIDHEEFRPIQMHAFRNRCGIQGGELIVILL